MPVLIAFQKSMITSTYSLVLNQDQGKIPITEDRVDINQSFWVRKYSDCRGGSPLQVRFYQRLFTLRVKLIVHDRNLEAGHDTNQEICSMFLIMGPA